MAILELSIEIKSLQDRLRGASATGAGEGQGIKMKLENPYFEKGYDGFGAGIMEPIINLYPNEWILKRIQHNAKAQRLPLDINKVMRYVETFPDYRKQSILYEISGQIYHGELKDIFKRDKVTPRRNYTKAEAAAYLGVSVKRIDQLLDEGKLEKLDKTSGNKVLIPGRSIIAYQVKLKK